MIAIGLVIGLLILFYRRDIFYALVVDWAVLGIYLKRSAESSVPASGVIAISIAAIALLTLGVLVQIVRRQVYR